MEESHNRGRFAARSRCSCERIHPARAAAVLLAVEGVALGVVVFREFAALVQGDTGSVASSVALLVLTLLGAAALVAFAVAVWRGSPGVGPAARWRRCSSSRSLSGRRRAPTPSRWWRSSLAVPAIIVLVLLVLAARRAARDAADEASE